MIEQIEGEKYFFTKEMRQKSQTLIRKGKCTVSPERANSPPAEDKAQVRNIKSCSDSRHLRNSVSQKWCAVVQDSQTKYTVSPFFVEVVVPVVQEGWRWVCAGKNTG